MKIGAAFSREIATVVVAITRCCTFGPNLSPNRGSSTLKPPDRSRWVHCTDGCTNITRYIIREKEARYEKRGSVVICQKKLLAGRGRSTEMRPVLLLHSYGPTYLSQYLFHLRVCLIGVSSPSSGVPHNPYLCMTLVSLVG